MKVVLLHPHGRNWLGSMKDISSIFNLMPPLGMMSIAAWLESKGIEVELFDCYAFPMPTQDTVTRVISKRPDVVGFSCTTSSFLEGYQIANGIKELAPEIKTVFGGAHACSVGVSLLDNFPAIDFLVIGEGEVTFSELLSSGFREVDKIPGIGYRRDGKGVLSGNRPHIADLDALPFPAYHLLPQFPAKYNLPLFSYPKAPNTSILSSRGCPYHCSYCDRSVFSRGFRFNSAGYIFEHLKFLNRDFGIRHVFFYDDLFTFDRTRVEELCRLLTDSRLPVTYNCIARLEHIDEELVGLLKKSGCWQLNFGIESGDPEILKKHRKYMELGNVHQKLKMVKNSGMRVKGLFMVGLPGEDEAAIRRTIEYALTLPLDEINVTKFTPFHGAPIYRDISEHGEFREEWPDMNCMNFVFIPNGMTLDQLENLYNEFIRRFYHRTCIHWGYTKMFWKSPHSVKTFLANLPEILKFELKQKW